MSVDKPDSKIKNAGDIASLTFDNIPSTSLPPETLESFDLEKLLNETQPPASLAFSRGKIKRAGRALRRNEGNLKEAIVVLHSFREEHEAALDYVADFISSLFNFKSTDKPLSFRRLKRLKTIVDKLQRPFLSGNKRNSMCVTRMNDIAGCRFVFSDLNELQKVKQAVVKNALQKSHLEIVNIYDYISQPKEDDCGYRCLHIVFLYYCKNKKKYRVEAQLRTKLQHIWATAVEITDIINQTEIKTRSFYQKDTKSDNQLKWEQLLRLMSEYIAFKEGALNLNQDRLDGVAEELKLLNEEIKAVEKLRSFRMVFDGNEDKVINQEVERHILCLIDDIKQDVLEFKLYSQEDEAIRAYNLLEKTYSHISGHRVLLVSTQDVEALQKAYPNYLGNCEEFVELLIGAMS